MIRGHQGVKALQEKGEKWFFLWLELCFFASFVSMVRHTPLRCFVLRFAIGTATCSPFTSPRGDGLTHYIDNQKKSIVYRTALSHLGKGMGWRIILIIKRKV